MKKLFSVIVVLFVFALNAKAQPMAPPTIRTIAIDSPTSTTLCWTQASLNGNNFVEYQIFYSDNFSGPYNLVQTIPLVGTQTITLTGLPIVPGSRYFYMLSKFNVSTLSISSDTVQSIFINVVANAATRTVSITWNSFNTGNTQTSYNVFRMIPSISPTYVQVNINTLPQTNFDDIIKFPTCADSIRYRVEIGDNIGCNNVSNVSGVFFNDNVGADTPVLQKVSVTPGQKTRLTWTVSPSIDVKGYTIYIINNLGSSNFYADVPGAGSTSTTLATSSPDLASETYKIAAYDSCGNTGGASLWHNTIFLTADLDACNGVGKLKWNKYNNLVGGVDKYVVYAQQNGSIPFQVASLTSTDSTYDHFPLIQGTQYTYTIVAFNTSGTDSSTSNTSSFTAIVPIRPAFLYIKYATVVNNRTVDIKFKHDTLADISGYVVYRSNNLGDTFDSLTYIHFNPLTSYLSYTDTTKCLTYKKSYVYKILAIDSCDQPTYYSDNVARTIFLKATPELDMKNVVTWTDYDTWNGNVRSYKVFRGFQGVFSDIPAATIPFGENTFEDDIANRISKDGEYCYYVQAYQGLDTIFFFADSSSSNKVCIKQQKTFYIPNAFQPDGVNKLFKPYSTFLNTNNYKFRIFDKWGERVFETTEPTSGWDGSINDKEAKVGVYVYYITFQDENFQTQEYRGTVSLLR